jgi:hypothetical protein
MRQTAMTEQTLYNGMRSKELWNERNRWVELAGRGGHPDPRLLCMG